MSRSWRDISKGLSTLMVPPEISALLLTFSSPVLSPSTARIEMVIFFSLAYSPAFHKWRETILYTGKLIMNSEMPLKETHGQSSCLYTSCSKLTPICWILVFSYLIHVTHAWIIPSLESQGCLVHSALHINIYGEQSGMKIVECIIR